MQQSTAPSATEEVDMRGDLETKILEVLWSTERPLYVRDVLLRINEQRDMPLAYTTVLTVLKRLTDKGAAIRKRTGRSFVYSPAAEDEAALAVRGVLHQHGEAAVMHFVKQASADPRLREELRLTANIS